MSGLTVCPIYSLPNFNFDVARELECIYLRWAPKFRIHLKKKAGSVIAGIRV